LTHDPIEPGQTWRYVYSDGSSCVYLIVSRLGDELRAVVLDDPRHDRDGQLIEFHTRLTFQCTRIA
jgi:hypothetical protein